MSDQETLIRVDSVSKRFCRNLRRSLIHGVCDIGSDLMGKNRSDAPLRKGEFWANQGISFELKRGECLGLIGHNGAGKTTLLKMLNGLICPDKGEIEIRGRVGALIALGAGFNPILTGRENVFIAGSVLGMSKREVQQSYDEIVDFADLSDFMETPVQSYSSGMQVRLGFAVATAMEPDVLLIDEVLAVGDSKFRAKCFNRIRELLKNTAVIFVSHQMPHVSRICNKGLFLSQGKCELLSDEIGEVVTRYEKAFGDGNTPQEISTPEGRISDVRIEHDPQESAAEVTVETELTESSREFTVSAAIENSAGEIVASAYSRQAAIRPYRSRKDRIFSFRIDTSILHSGSYKLQIGILGYPDDILIAKAIGTARFTIIGASVSPVSVKARVHWNEGS